MAKIKISICEPFISPSWGSSIVIFSSHSGAAIDEASTKDYLAKACRYASKFKILLIPERFTINGVEGLCVISGEGKVVTAQQQIYFKHNEHANNSLNIAETPYGKVCLCVNDDIYQPEISRIAKNRGAVLVVSSQLFPLMENNNHKIVAGVWGMAQDNNIITICASNQFNVVCAPREITKNKEGFILAPTSKSVVAEIDIAKLKALPDRFFLPRQFYRNYREDLIGELFTK